jgi:hypothetical protein
MGKSELRHRSCTKASYGVNERLAEIKHPWKVLTHTPQQSRAGADSSRNTSTSKPPKPLPLHMEPSIAMVQQVVLRQAVNEGKKLKVLHKVQASASNY